MLNSLLSSRARETGGLALSHSRSSELWRSQISGRGARWQRGVPRAREAAATCPRGSRGRRGGGGTVCAGSRTQGSIGLPASHVKTPAALSSHWAGSGPAPCCCCCCCGRRGSCLGWPGSSLRPPDCRRLQRTPWNCPGIWAQNLTFCQKLKQKTVVEMNAKNTSKCFK